MRQIFGMVSAIIIALTANAAWAGASSVSTLGDGASRIEKINRHALKSAVLLRQLLAQNGITGVTTSNQQNPPRTVNKVPG